jgi:hypothetical protein
MFLSWAIPLPEALCHVYGSACAVEGSARKNSLAYCRKYIHEAPEQDPNAAGWHARPDLLVVHLLYCKDDTGSCSGGEHCRSAKVILGHLYSCEAPGCTHCVAWAQMSCSQDGLQPLAYYKIITKADAAMRIFYSCLPAYLHTLTVPHNKQLPVDGRRRTDRASGMLKHPLEGGADPTMYMKGIDGCHAKGHSEAICASMDTGRVRQLLERPDLKKGQTGETLHSVIKPALRFLNQLEYFGHTHCMKVLLTLLNERMRVKLYDWWCKRTCTCSVAAVNDTDVWAQHCTCEGKNVGLDPFRRYCDMRTLQPLPT